MGNCKSTPESNCNDGFAVFELVADIVGPGVSTSADLRPRLTIRIQTLVASPFAATLTTGAIFISYFKGWLPENALSDTDREFLRRRSKASAAGPPRRFTEIQNQRVQGASRFDLALSDQH